MKYFNSFEFQVWLEGMNCFELRINNFTQYLFPQNIQFSPKMKINFFDGIGAFGLNVLINLMNVYRQYWWMEVVESLVQNMLSPLGQWRQFCCFIWRNSPERHAEHLNYETFFSSPELKAQVSFSDRLSSVVCLSVCLSVCQSVNFSYFRLLLQNHWVNFNQT